VDDVELVVHVDPPMEHKAYLHRSGRTARAGSEGDVEVTVLDEADHMADLGFLPAVRRLLRQTPERSQRLLFSATLDRQVDAVVAEFLQDPVTQEADSAHSPVAEMTHHVLHVDREHRLSVLVDLASAPGRTVVFARTKHGAKALTRQLNRSGVAAVELHGNLGQGARTRNMEAFHSGKAMVLVATDIAARGIHVDDVALVVHADPPAEHKAYLHRSGRTARAGNAGTVITLMTSDQVRDVRALVRAAGIKPTTTRIDGAHHPVMVELAPGERRLTAAIDLSPSSPRPRTRSGSSDSAGAARGRGDRAQRSSHQRRTPAGTDERPQVRSRRRRRRTPASRAA
jgi:superfamily II DNA/RNA helicase